ncbi:unnamed protein product, partial [Ectocarpus sp. 12 AP-2014]
RITTLVLLYTIHVVFGTTEADTGCSLFNLQQYRLLHVYSWLLCHATPSLLLTRGAERGMSEEGMKITPQDKKPPPSKNRPSTTDSPNTTKSECKQASAGAGEMRRETRRTAGFLPSRL